MIQWRYSLKANLRYPRITWCGIGFGAGLIIVIVLGYLGNSTIDTQKELYERTIVLQRETLSKQTLKIDTLKTEKADLVSQLKRHTITRPDGTVEETVESSSASHTESVESIKLSLQLEFSEKLRTVETEYRAKLTKYRKPNRLSIGYGTDLLPYVGISHTVFGPIIIEGSVNQGLELRLGIGIEL